MSSPSLRARVNSVARTALGPLPLGFWERTFPKDLLALCYHVVSDDDVPHLKLYGYKNRRQFEADVRFARDRAVTYRRLREHRLGGAALPRNSILFTFDDGLAQCYDVIRPILLRERVDGVFFVTTDYLDDAEPFYECALSLCLDAAARAPLQVLATLAASTRNAAALERGMRRLQSIRHPVGDGDPRRPFYAWLLSLDESDGADLARACTALGVDVAAYAARNPIFMSREQVRRLAADGFTVGAHGRKHRSLEDCDPVSIEREIVESCRVVSALTGQTRVPFAFPYSGVNIDRNSIAGIVERNEVVDLVFDSGCLRRDPRFIINRVFADAPSTAGGSNIPATLRGAWSVPSAWFRAPGGWEAV